MSSRKSYRNKMVRKDLLEIHFQADGGKTLKGRLLDVHSEGAAVLLDAPKGFKLASGAKGQLRFSSDSLDEPFSVGVEVRSSRTQDTSLRVGFRFAENLPFQHRWPRSLRSPTAGYPTTSTPTTRSRSARRSSTAPTSRGAASPRRASWSAARATTPTATCCRCGTRATAPT